MLVRILGQPKRSGPFSPQAPPKPATRLLLHQPGAGDVIGMTVGIHRVEQFQVQFAKQGQVTIHLLEHRVDDHGLPGVLIREYAVYVEEVVSNSCWKIMTARAPGGWSNKGYGGRSA